jgi:uncharacterized protein (TIGR03435 family)
MRQVEILLVDDIAGPMAFGCRRPTILLPAEVTSWTERDVERALVHELEHLRRADWAVQVFARGVCALYWLHPLVWVCWREMRLQAEQACDDIVLRYSDAPDYAGQLVAIAGRMTVGYSHSPLAMAHRRDLSTRIAAILEEGRTRGRAGWQIRVLLTVAAATLVTVIAPLRVEAVSQTTSFSGALRGFTEVSVRRNQSQEPMALQPLPGGRLRIVNAPLRILIRVAYGVQTDDALVGVPEWIERFDIVAAAGRDVTLDEMPLLLRALLEDRFKLQVRSEMREMSVFALRSLPGGQGAALRLSSTECAAARVSVPAGPTTATTVMNPCGFHVAPGKLVATGVTLRALASSLSNYVGRPVLDQTNSTDHFDLDLSWASDGPPADSIATAIEAQLGLGLEPARASLEVLVVEAAERPIEN